MAFQKRRIVYLFVGLVLYCIAFFGSNSLFTQILVKLYDGNFSQASTFSGYLSALNSFASFLMAPSLGLLSDRFGRKPLFIISLLATMIDLTAFGCLSFFDGKSYKWVLYISRSIAGAGNSFMAVSFAMLADVTPPKMRSKAFGLIGIAFGFGVLIGGLGGGELAKVINLSLPLAVFVVILFIAILYGIFVLPETKPKEEFRFEWRRANPLRSFALFGQSKLTLWLAIIAFMTYFGLDALIDVGTLYYQYRWHFNPLQISSISVVFAITQIIAQGPIILLLMPRLGERNLVLICLFLNAAFWWAYGILPINLSWIVYILSVFTAISIIAIPTLQGMISRQYRKEHQGELAGVVTGLRLISNSVAPILFNSLFSYYISDNPWPTQIPGISYFLCSGIYGMSFLTALVVFKLIREPTIESESVRSIINIPSPEEEEEEEYYPDPDQIQPLSGSIHASRNGEYTRVPNEAVEY